MNEKTTGFLRNELKVLFHSDRDNDLYKEIIFKNNIKIEYKFIINSEDLIISIYHLESE
jgi:hypothetical protein